MFRGMEVDFSSATSTSIHTHVSDMTAQHFFEREALVQLDALRNFALKLCSDEHQSNDLVQETMLKACLFFHTYKQGTNCRAWLFQICKNSYINSYRRKRYEPLLMDFQNEPSLWNSVPDAGEPWGPHPEISDDTTYQMQTGFLSDEVIRALDTLPREYQTALILSDIEAYTYEEIAEFTRAPIGTVRSRIHRGRRMLADRLEQYASAQGYRIFQ
jgi:RNA polymerase sigma-70 factor (ECF subfamily)